MSTRSTSNRMVDMVDVIVIGGGAAGMISAIAASREGASVILL